MKRFAAIVLALMLVASLGVSAFAEGNTITMDLKPNQRTYTYEDGSRPKGYVIEDVLDEFNWLRHGNGMYWGQLDSAQMVFEFNDEGDWKAVSQYVITKTGLKVVTSDPNVVMVDTDTKMHATGAGEAVITVYDAEGNERISYDVSVSGQSFSSYVLVNLCDKCGQDQSSALHYMSCGHYACELGREGHGDAGCGYYGHYACDGGDHSYCFNCLRPVCQGEHGKGICPHAHNPVHVAWDRVPTCTLGGIERIMCAGCGACAIVQTEPQHDYFPFNKCILCGAVRP